MRILSLDCCQSECTLDVSFIRGNNGVTRYVANVFRRGVFDVYVRCVSCAMLKSLWTRVEEERHHLSRAIIEKTMLVHNVIREPFAKRGPKKVVYKHSYCWYL